MAVRAMLRTESTLRASCKPGCGAIKATELERLVEDARPGIDDSLALDEALRSRHPNDPRWDYLIGARSQVIGLEIHAARSDQVSLVIAKKQHAVTQLQGHCRPNRAPSQWIWVASGRVGFPSMSREQLRLVQHGIKFVGRLRRSDLEPARPRR